MSIDFFSIFFYNYKKQHPSFAQIESPKRHDEDSYFRSNRNNSDDNLSFLSPINSNRRNEDFNPDLFSRQNIGENFPLQNILNEDRTMAGTTQIPDNPENNNYSLFINPIYIQSQQPNEDLDNNFNGNSLIGISFLRDQSSSNNANSIFNQNCPPIQNIGNSPNELRTRPTATQIPTNPKNNNDLLNISLSSIKSSQSINNSDDNFNENILNNNSSSGYHTNSNNRNINANQNNFPSQNIGNIPNEQRISSIATQMLANPESRAGINCHLFKVKKVLNRKRKRDNIDSDKAEIHDKNETKNILTKTKKAVYNNDIKFTNKAIEDSPDEEIKKKK